MVRGWLKIDILNDSHKNMAFQEIIYENIRKWMFDKQTMTFKNCNYLCFVFNIRQIIFSRIMAFKNGVDYISVTSLSVLMKERNFNIGCNVEFLLFLLQFFCVNEPWNVKGLLVALSFPCDNHKRNEEIG